MKFELDLIISKLKEGKKAKQIAEELGISKSNLSYYLGKLKKSGELEYKGNGVWGVQKLLPTHSSPKSKYVRGHAFIWKIKLGRKIDWEKHLTKSKLDYKKQSNGKVLRIFFNKRKIWLTREGLIIYETFDFWGNNSYESKGKAVFTLDRLIKSLFSKIGMSIISYQFSTSREHYGLVKNEMARQYNEKGEKLLIKGEDGKEWMWIDDSLGLGELENNEMNINKKVQDWYNDHKKHNFSVTPTFLLESINGLVKNNQMYMQNIESHITSVKQLGSSAEANAISTELLANTIKQMQEAFTEQIELLREEVSQLRNSKKD